MIRDKGSFDSLGLEGDAFVIGGAQIYTELLPQCDEVLLSFVYEAHQGDTHFPAFEDQFELAEVVEKFDDFELRRYTRSA